MNVGLTVPLFRETLQVFVVHIIPKDEGMCTAFTESALASHGISDRDVCEILHAYRVARIQAAEAGQSFLGMVCDH